jgi:Cysteine-rich secretory protein family
VVLLVGIVLFVLSGASRAWADGQETTGYAESYLTTHINMERSSRGLGTLAVADDLVALARQHSADMAAAGHPYHDPNIQSEVQNWQHMGDNVGSGPDAESLHQAFMNSQVHREEILMPDYTQVGVGAYWSGNVLYVTEIFRRPADSNASPANASPAPSPTSTAAPRPHQQVAPARVVRPAAPPAVTTQPPAAPPTTTATPPSTAPASTTTSIDLPQIPMQPWPPASVLASHRGAASSPVNNPLTPFAAVGAVLLMTVGGILVATLRRRSA